LLENLCQVCGGPASRTAQEWLYLIAAADAAEVVEGMHSMKPPVCLPCAGLALLHCPHLSDTTAPLAVRVRRPRARAVYGDFYLPDATGRLTRAGGGLLPYTHRHRAWFLASQLVAELRRCTVVDLATELAA
jgi:hypothetical protein